MTPAWICTISCHLSWRIFVSQAEKDLQPWIARDDEQGQKMWRVNQRIVKLIAEVMRNHDSPEALVILASASDLLLRATDGMLVDGEACTLPQLEVTSLSVIRFLHWKILLTKSPILLRCHWTESTYIFHMPADYHSSNEFMQLLEVTARAVHLIIEWGDSGLSVADGLSNLLKACPLLWSPSQSLG